MFMEGESASMNCTDDRKEDLATDDAMNDEAWAYVDGSFDVTSGLYACGVVLGYGGEEITISRKFEDSEMARMRNVAGEIEGSKAAIDYCLKHNITRVTIYHDYQGISSWPLGEWKANLKGTMAYVEYYKKASEKVAISFVKVKGHSNNKYNDMADHLAKAALGIE